jgi:hypothetical protein
MQSKHLLYAALALTTIMRGDTQSEVSMHYAREASAMLGPTLWKRVIRVQNSSTDSHYPRSFGAVVFAMGGILWFYTDTDGTQSLSLRRGHVSVDEQDFGPLLAHIDPGFSHWEFDSEGPGMGEKDAVPPNACFIQSVMLLRHSLSEGVSAEHARLLSYYVTLPDGLKGHTVLYLETSKGPTIIDPLMQRRPFSVRGSSSDDPKSVAYCIRRDVTSARWVPFAPDDFAAKQYENTRFANN